MSTTARAAALELFEHHRGTLERAVQAIAERGYWSPFPESLKQYPEEAVKGAQAAFDALLGQHFALAGPQPVGRAGAERSPYGFDLNVSYDQYDADALLARMQAALPAWRDAGAKARVGACLEILQRLN